MPVSLYLAGHLLLGLQCIHVLYVKGKIIWYGPKNQKDKLTLDGETCCRPPIHGRTDGRTIAIISHKIVLTGKADS